MKDDSSSSLRDNLHQKWRVSFPSLTREERLDLVGRFESSACWNADFIVMMCLATSLAGLGLLQNSTAVVIGGMLVAPLMSPLIGAGFALVQGNMSLFRDSLKAMAYGALAALAIAVVLGFVTPAYEPTIEIESRGQVNLLDLGVALLSGMAAAYAMARPNVAAIMSGVAIAAALVPPLAAAGLTLPDGHFWLSASAATLFLTNLVAIILGAALVFRLLGVSGSLAGARLPNWARNMVAGLLAVTCLLALPLTNRLVSQAKIGQDRPANYAVSPELRQQILARVQLEGDVELISVLRHASSLEPTVIIVLASSRPLGINLHDELVELVKQQLGSETKVRVLALSSAWQEPTFGES